MTHRAKRITIVIAVIGALGGAVLIVARAPQSPAGPTPSAAYGH